jgi:hypothetical protein
MEHFMKSFHSDSSLIRVQQGHSVFFHGDFVLRDPRLVLRKAALYGSRGD